MHANQQTDVCSKKLGKMATGEILIRGRVEFFQTFLTMKLSNHTQFYNFLSLDLFTYLMLKEFIFQCLFTRICTSSFKERLVILWKNQSTCYPWKVKDKTNQIYLDDSLLEKPRKPPHATPCGFTSLTVT